MDRRIIGGRLVDGDEWVWVEGERPPAPRPSPLGRWLAPLTGGLIAVALLVIVTQFATGGAGAQTSATIDFAGLSEGDIVSSVSCGSGVSCAGSISGSIGVFGLNPSIGAGTNAAMIFDAECSSGCSGGDDDLNFPGQGNVPIVSEDLDSSDPDDADLPGEHLDLDLSGFGPGVAHVSSLAVMDVDALPGKVQVFSGGPGGTLVAEVPLPLTGDNGIQTVAIGATGDFLRVILNDSGAIDDIELEVDQVISGRMTGGGSVFMVDGARVTRGFEIHCDLRDPNNIEVNWPGGNKFHMTQLTSAVCTDDPAIMQDPPPGTSFDTFTGEGTGKLNNVPGATIHFVFVDAGEPGKDDTAAIQIWDASGTLVLEVSGFIDVGNLQAHND